MRKLLAKIKMGIQSCETRDLTVRTNQKQDTNDAFKTVRMILRKTAC